MKPENRLKDIQIALKLADWLAMRSMLTIMLIYL